ncbi:hypothetical protein SAMN04489740_2161 [Arthrobacter alpinus]|uniref:Uncharacterized protein n=1 Tax=Arthrobacter alpinus TaxID=656366 RepID=A0A1H5KTA8_9MICC|nr:hypothetical protein [Arthrobacter alpinus]SEE68052.1 hypothetical protein SAMN04489740_2161 [Arthrobacter alpinus]
MTSLGTGKMSKPGKFSGLGTIVLAIVFLVALVFAANNSTVLGWVIAIIAFGWLALSTVVYIGVHKAAAFGARQVALAQAQMAQQNSANAPADGGTRLVSQDSGSRSAEKARDLKLDHSFKIINVQIGVVNEYLGKDPQMVARALETINITAANGRGMINPDWEAQEAKMDAAMARKNAERAAAQEGSATPKPGSGKADGGGDEAVSGVILD